MAMTGHAAQDVDERAPAGPGGPAEPVVPVGDRAEPAWSDRPAGGPGQPAVGGFTEPPKGRFGRLTDRLRASPAWLAPIALLGCAAGAGALLLANDPTDGRPDPYGGCLFKYATGLDCPGCGGTRALWFLLHGNLPEAARHHLIAVFAAPFLAYLYLTWAVRTIFHVRLPELRIQPRYIGFFLGAWGVWMVLRNLPWPPFTYFYV